MQCVVPTILLGSILVASGTSADLVPSFQGLGVLPGGNNSWAYGVSADGTTVVGTSQSDNPYVQAFRWTAEQGMVGLGWLPGGGHTTRGTRVSADGSVVVGNAWYVGECTITHAFRWTPDDGVVDLGTLTGLCGQSFGHGVSGDGSVVVGSSSAEIVGTAPYRWTPEEGMVTLSGVGGGGATDVSADGTVVVGGRPHGALSEAFWWTEETGPVGLGDLPGGAFFSSANAVSADGEVVVGESDSHKRTEAFRWTEDQGMVGLGVLWDYQGYGRSHALDTNADGTVVVGDGVIDVYGNTAAFIWDEQTDMRRLQDVLETEYGLDLDGWHLLEAKGVSDDGLTIVGYGDGPAGRREAWVARVPEPSTLLLIAMCALGMPRARSRL